MKVKVIKEFVHLLKGSYEVGEECEFDKEYAQELIDSGYVVSNEKKPTSAKKTNKKDA